LTESSLRPSRRGVILSNFGISAKLTALATITVIAFAGVLLVAFSGVGKLAQSVSELKFLQTGLVTQSIAFADRVGEAQLELYRAGTAAMARDQSGESDNLTKLQAAIDAARGILSDIKSNTGVFAIDPKALAAVVKAFDSW